MPPVIPEIHRVLHPLEKRLVGSVEADGFSQALVIRIGHESIIFLYNCGVSVNILNPTILLVCDEMVWEPLWHFDDSDFWDHDPATLAGKELLKWELLTWGSIL